MNKYLISYSYVRYNPNGSRSGIASGNTSVNAASESEAREIVQTSVYERSNQNSLITISEKQLLEILATR
ncbi:hypothetical protein HMI54_009855 [Coelomomyces lativittatus]|nr:hypothetical protein HMI54_009855 [Coelomomyces lativittatus]